MPSFQDPSIKEVKNTAAHRGHCPLSRRVTKRVCWLQEWLKGHITSAALPKSCLHSLGVAMKRSMLGVTGNHSTHFLQPVLSLFHLSFPWSAHALGRHFRRRISQGSHLHSLQHFSPRETLISGTNKPYVKWVISLLITFSKRL